MATWLWRSSLARKKLYSGLYNEYNLVYYSPMSLKGMDRISKILFVTVMVTGTLTIVLGLAALIVFA